MTDHTTITNTKRLSSRDVIIKDTHRGLWYEDGQLVRVLTAGRYVLPGRGVLPFTRHKRVEVVLVDVRERELTIKGQEILTSDKVAIRVSIVVQFRVVDPAAALQRVAAYEDRLYSDVQLAARRSLASMTLEEILTHRTRLSEDILADVLGSAATYGVEIRRADVKDLIFPGNLQEIMNRVLATERLSQAQLVEARTKAEAQRIEAAARAEARALESAAELDAMRQREQVAQVFAKNPALLRLRELETLRELSQLANARIYIGFPKHVRVDGLESTED